MVVFKCCLLLLFLPSLIYGDVANQGPFAVPGDIVYGCPTLKGIAVTFASGPNVFTNQLLDTLDKYNVTAAFFVQGAFAKKYPSIIKRMFESGHVIGSHSYDHPNLVQLYQSNNISEIERQITETEEVLRGITGSRPWLFRPPFGALNSAVKDIVVRHGYTIVMWNAGCTDWYYQNMTLETEQVAKGMGASGGITCWHDPYENTATKFQVFLEAHKRAIVSFQDCLMFSGASPRISLQIQKLGGASLLLLVFWAFFIGHNY